MQGASATQAAVFALVGALGGTLVTAVVSLTTLRWSQQGEARRRAEDRSWEREAELRAVRRKAYTRFLREQNAIIMAAGSVRRRVEREGRFTAMPESMAPVYERLQNAWAEALVVAGPQMRRLLTETQGHLDELVWASWEGRWADLPEALPDQLVNEMQAETMSFAAGSDLIGHSASAGGGREQDPHTPRHVRPS